MTPDATSSSCDRAIGYRSKCCSGSSSCFARRTPRCRRNTTIATVYVSLTSSTWHFQLTFDSVQSGTTNIITIHQYGGAPALPSTWFGDRSTPVSPVTPHVASRPLPRRSPSLPAPVAASPPGSWSRGSRRRRSRGPPTGSMASARPAGLNRSAGHSRRGPSSWTWVRDADLAVPPVTSEASPSEVCLINLQSCAVRADGGQAGEKVGAKVESPVRGV